MEESEKKSLVAEIAQLVVNTLKPLLPKQEPEGGRTRATDRSWISTHFTVVHPGQGQKSWLARRSCVCSRRWGFSHPSPSSRRLRELR